MTFLGHRIHPPTIEGHGTVTLTTRRSDRRNTQRGPARSEGQTTWLEALDVLAWSIWFGLLAGLLEVGTRVLCRAIDPTKRLYLMSRHFVWLTPLSNMLLFLVWDYCWRVSRGFGQGQADG